MRKLSQLLIVALVLGAQFQPTIAQVSEKTSVKATQFQRFSNWMDKKYGASRNEIRFLWEYGTKKMRRQAVSNAEIRRANRIFKKIGITVGVVVGIILAIVSGRWAISKYQERQARIVAEQEPLEREQAEKQALEEERQQIVKFHKDFSIPSALVDKVQAAFNIEDNDAETIVDYFAKTYGQNYTEKLDTHIERFTFFKDQGTAYFEYPQYQSQKPDVYSAFRPMKRDDSEYIIFKSSETPRIAPVLDKGNINETKATGIKAVVDVYKIHLNPKAKDHVRVAISLLSDTDLMNMADAMKIRRRIGGLHPGIVIYTYQGAAQAKKILQKVCRLVGSIEGNGTVPRFNKPVGDKKLIYVAQGNGDEKEKQFLEKWYEDEGNYKKVYYSKAFNERGGNPDYKIDVSCP